MGLLRKIFGPNQKVVVDVLYSQVPGVIKDIARLKSLFYLFALMLDQLCIIDSAYEDDPDVVLK